MNILVLCTGNSARSILAESLLNRLGADRGIRAFSAGSKPTGQINPAAIALLREKGYPVEGLRSKSWEEFARPDAPEMDLVITVCDSAASEPCPVWPGAPLQVHWGIPDPAAVTEPEEAVRAAFEQAYERLERRVRAFLALLDEDLPQDAFRRRVAAIGQMED